MSARFTDDLLTSSQFAGAITAETWLELRRVLPGQAFETWAEGLQRLTSSDRTGVLARRFAQASLAVGGRLGADACLTIVPAALALAAASGQRSLLSLFRMLPLVAEYAGQPHALHAWARTIEEVCALAPESADAVVQQSAVVLARLSVRGFRSWVFNGIHASDGDAAWRLSYFSQTDAHALSSFERIEGDVVLADIEVPLRAFLRGLWNLQPALRAAAVRPGAKAPRRSSLDGLFIQVPEVYAGYRGQQAVAHYFAALAHAGAHIVFTPARMQRGSLRPLQIALVGLIEDARVEALAIRNYPGLRRLWSRFHSAQAGVGLTAELLMMRLARALIDPSYVDDDPWVEKGRRMFFGNEARWQDPSLSRELGNLLGNDLGQMRIQFNPKSYVVEPSYRDDSSGLWQFDEPPPEQSEAAETVMESVRITEREEEDRREKHEQQDDTQQHASMAALAKAADEDAGVPIGRHAEWDYVSGTLRHGWVTVLEFRPKLAPADQIDAVLRKYDDVERRIAKLVRAAKVSRPRRMRGQAQGDRLDLDATIRARIEQRSNMMPDTRIYERTEMLSRDLSVLLLLDVSESTRDRVKDTTTTVLAMERAAAAMLAQAMHELGDPFAIHAFCSNGRLEVRYTRVKDFSEPYTPMTRSALAGLRGMMSTRLGAALRQAGDEIERQATHRKLILVITDGEPSDIDTPDPAYLVEDARRAVHALSHRGINVFCVGLESEAKSALPRIFGSRNFLKIARIEALPERLPILYMRLTI